MRVLISMLKHETNTFSPVPTTIDRFKQWSLAFDSGVVRKYRNTLTPTGAYIAATERRKGEITTPIAAEAMPSGIITLAVYEELVTPILDKVRTIEFDAILLDLHGAMVVDSIPDGDGELLKRIREIAPNIPIGVTCDFHANTTRMMIENSTILAGYKTYPHIDKHVIGSHVANLIFDNVDNKIKPIQVWGNRPLLAQTLKMGTDDEPMKDLINKTRELEETNNEILAATLFGGFPLSDIPDAGVSAVIVADGNKALANTKLNKLLDDAWSERENFVYHGQTLEASIRAARKYKDGPTLLLDHADNCGSGATQDVMVVVEELIKQDLKDVIVAAIYDPDFVKACENLPKRKVVKLELGGKYDMPSLNLRGKPLIVEGEVIDVIEGEWTIKGDMYRGVRVNTGKTALFRTKGLDIVVTSYHHEPWDKGIFEIFGIDPSQRRYIMLKSRIHHRKSFGPIIKRTILCDGVGVATSDNSLLKYSKLSKPVYPLTVQR